MKNHVRRVTADLVVIIQPFAKDGRTLELYGLVGGVGPPAWKVEIDVTGGDGDLMACCAAPVVVAGVIILISDAEHVKGSIHGHAAHGISQTGELLWTREGEFERATQDGEVLVLERAGGNDVRLDPKTGSPV